MTHFRDPLYLLCVVSAFISGPLFQEDDVDQDNPGAEVGSQFYRH